MGGFSQKSEDALRDVTERLVSRYGGSDEQGVSDIRRRVLEEADRYREAPVHAFVPILVERAIRGQLETAPAGLA